MRPGYGMRHPDLVALLAPLRPAVTERRRLGFLHFRYVDAQPDDHPYPHPDFLQVVYTGPAHRRDGRAADWIDHDGWEQGHRLLTVSDLSGIDLTAVQRVFIDLLAGTSGTDR